MGIIGGIGTTELLIVLVIVVIIGSAIVSKNILKSTESNDIKKLSSNIELLEKYKRMLDSGVITQAEFDEKKKGLLG